MIIYQALYNSCIHESVPGTISLHKTKKGAEMAVEFHKAKEKAEFDEYYERSSFAKATDVKFGEHEWWGVQETELKD